jgi:hypothetical protein
MIRRSSRSIFQPELTATKERPDQVTATRLAAAIVSLRATVVRQGPAWPLTCRKLLDQTFVQFDEVVSFAVAGGHA